MKTHLKSLVLPLLVAAYPILFLYGHNALVLNLGSLTLPLIATLLVAGLGYGLFFLLLRRPITASLAAAVFAIFYYLYGFIYQLLLKQDKIMVEHYTLLPLVTILAVYIGYGVTFIKPNIAAVIQKVLLVVSVCLVTFNVFFTLPVEVRKAEQKRAPIPVTARSTTSRATAKAATAVQPAAAAEAAMPGQKHPDIYYIIFDEYVGFDAMRDYWHDPLAAQFDTFLKQNNFFVAINSRSPTINTGTEMASRLNLETVPETADQNAVLASLVNNKVMQIVKSYGYTTVGINMAYPGLQADVVVEFDPQKVSGMAPSQFKETFLKDTMFSAFTRYFEASDPSAIRQRDMIMTSLNRTVNLSDVKSPKFVYTHLLLPHPPFIFDENGKLLPPQDWNDWHYYLGQYKYATKQAMQLITNLKAKADPNNPPIIIIQSDEGARNLQDRTEDNIITNGYLENYPAQYNQYILNALYLPGYDYSQLKDDMPPVETFQIVLNHYLNAGVTIGSWQGK